MTLHQGFSIFIIILFIIGFYLLAKGFSLKKENFTRERFAFFAVTSLFSFASALISSIISNLNIWLFWVPIIEMLTNNKIPIPQPSVIEIIASFSIFFALGIFVLQFYKNWDGKKSELQYKREEGSVQPSITIFIKDGLIEFPRILGFIPPLEEHSPDRPPKPEDILKPVSESLVWKDRARELIRLTSNKYIFSSSIDDDWYDTANCWIGEHSKTNTLFSLLPCETLPDENTIKKWIQASNKIAHTLNRRLDEFIIATLDNHASNILRFDEYSIRHETEASLLDKLVDFSDYKNEIKRRVTKENLPDSTLTLKDVFVSSDFENIYDKTIDKDLINYLVAWLKEPSSRHIAILGEFGQGKSSVSIMLAYHILFERDDIPRIPIVIELRGKSPKNQTPIGILGEWVATYRINAQALMSLLISGRVLIIFEGFDEMDLRGDTNTRISHFVTLWQFAYPKSKIIITGRPNFFFDDSEMVTALGIADPQMDRPYCQALRLKPFSLDKLNQALSAYNVSVREPITQLANRNPRFAELVSRPSMMHIVAMLWNREKLYEKINELTSAFVMRLFILNSYRRQGLKEKDAIPFMALNTSEREYFMRAVAIFMVKNNQPNFISGTQLNQLIQKLVENMPEAISTNISTIQGETRIPLRQRIASDEFGLDHVNTDIRSTSLLVDDPANFGSFRFGHKSFMEYLIAEVMADYILESTNPSAKSILSITSASIYDMRKEEVAIDFLVELLSQNLQASWENKEKYKSKEDAEYIFASELFKKIYSESQFLYKEASKLNIILSLRKDLGWVKTILIILSSSRLAIFILLIFLFSFIFSIIINSTISYLPQPSQDYTNTIAILFLLLNIMMVSTTMLMNVQRKIQKEQLQNYKFPTSRTLWNYICKEMEISNSTMYRVFGLNRFIQLQNIEFRHFLDNKAKKTLEDDAKT